MFRFKSYYQIFSLTKRSFNLDKFDCVLQNNYQKGFNVTQISRIATTQQSSANINMDVDEFEKLRRNKKSVVIDVRDADEISKFGKIEGTYNIPFDVLEKTMKDEKELKKLGLFDKIKDSRCNLIFHCMKGRRSIDAAHIAQSLGYKAKHLMGGYEAWKSKHN